MPLPRLFFYLIVRPKRYTSELYKLRENETGVELRDNCMVKHAKKYCFVSEWKTWKKVEKKTETK